MTAAAIGFYASAGVAVLAALAAVLARRPEQTLAGYVVAFAALLLPLIELGATTVAAVLLLAVVVSVTLLGILGRARVETAGGPSRSIAYWILAGLGVLGFAWVLLATGSRQVVDLGDPLPRSSTFGDGDALLRELGATFVAPSLVIGLLALAAVIAAVLGQLPAHEREEP